jgi:hypothetical protein
MHTWSDNKVRELATVCLPWQHWTKALVRFDAVDISAFHSCVVVDLWQSLSGICYCLRVFLCAAARMSELELEHRTNIKFLVKLRKGGNEIKESNELMWKNLVEPARPEMTVWRANSLCKPS